MDFLGIGPLELLFVLVIALIVLGPRDIVSLARRAGRLLNRIYRSEVWGTINQASREFRDLPNRLAREAALEDLDERIRQGADPDAKIKAKGTNPALDAWTPSPKSTRAATSDEGATAKSEKEPPEEQPSSRSEADSS